MKARIKFRKYGAIRFIGHLDVMRYFQKVMRRADIPIAFTGGYSPHMIMSFASPLGIGLEVFLHSGPPGQKFRAAPQNGAPGRRRLGRGEGHFLPLLVFLFAHADSPQLSASISGCSISLKRPVSFIAWTGSRYSALVSDSLGPTVN